MGGESISGFRERLESLLSDAVTEVRPEIAVRRALKEVSIPAEGPVNVVAVGKAALPMAGAVEERFGGRCRGLVLCKEGFGGSCAHLEVMEGTHPYPSQRNLEHTKRITDFIGDLREEDFLLVLISGGASALLVHPREGIALEDKIAATRTLVKRDVPIQRINCIRKHLSSIKGGGMLRLTPAGRILSLILSDVPGNDLEAIGSGPTVPDPTTFEDCLEIMEAHGLRDDLPPRVVRYLEEGAAGLHEETLKPSSPEASKATNIIVADNSRALERLCRGAEDLGWRTTILARDLQCSLHEALRLFEREAERRRRSGVEYPVLLAAGGEVTLEVRGDGKGGRNQQFALELAGILRETAPAVGGALATDGNDGPTDAAGGIVDHESWERMERAGISPEAAIERNDAYNALKASGDLLITGPTRTNVCDLYFCLLLP